MMRLKRNNYEIRHDDRTNTGGAISRRGRRVPDHDILCDSRQLLLDGHARVVHIDREDVRPASPGVGSLEVHSWTEIEQEALGS